MALVVDIGGDTCRVGLAGEEFPRLVVPSRVVTSPCGVVPLRSELQMLTAAWRPCLSYNSNSCDSCWDAEALNALISLSLVGGGAPPGAIPWPSGGAGPEQEPLPVLLSEPNQISDKFREIVAEALFETHAVPAISFCSRASLSAFSCGRTSALVVDVGAGLSSVAPVCDGCVVGRASGAIGPLREATFAGQALDSVLLEELHKHGVEPSQGTVPEGRRSLVLSRLAQDVKESICFCAHAPVSTLAAVQDYVHTLPDGQRVNVAAFSREVPEALWTGRAEFVGLPKLFDSSVQALLLGGMSQGVAAAKEVVGSTLLVGGTTRFVNFKNRFESSVSETGRRLGTSKKLKVHLREHRYAAWAGGSVLASTEAAGPRWVTHDEFKDNGFRLFHERCV